MASSYLLDSLPAVSVHTHTPPADWLPCPDAYIIGDLSTEPSSPYYDNGEHVPTPEWTSPSPPVSPFSDSRCTSDFASPTVDEVTQSLSTGLHFSYYDQWSPEALQDYQFTFQPQIPLSDLPAMAGDEQYLTNVSFSPVESVGLGIAFSPVSSPLSTISEITVPTLPSPILTNVSTMPPIRVSAEIANAKVSGIFENDSDVDAEGESDAEESDDDGEYVPNRLLLPRQRRSYRNAYASGSSTRATRSSRASSGRGTATRPNRVGIKQSPSVTSSPLIFDNSVDSHVIRTAPRRIQVSIDSIDSRADKTNKQHWNCPHCSYVQTNHREPDLRRHISTHFRTESKGRFLCCGVPSELALEYGVPGPEQGAEVRYFWGRPMVGGCGVEVSRKDALRRHLRNARHCIADLAGQWHPFNQPDEA